MVSSLLLVGFAVSISYPIVALIKGPSVVATASYEQLKNSDGLSIVQRTNLRANRRFIFLKSEVFEGTRGLSSLQRGWLPILGIPHPLILSRNGYPTPAGTSSYQDPGTLSIDLGYTEFYANQCSPRLYDFWELIRSSQIIKTKDAQDKSLVTSEVVVKSTASNQKFVTE